MRVLLIAEEANPEWVSVPLVGWSHARAIARVVDAHTVTQIRNRDAFVRAGVRAGEFTAIDSEAVAARVYKIATALRGGAGAGWTTNTAFSALSYLYFERLVWHEFGARIAAREFDLVHRVTPLSPTIPSPIASKVRKAGVPFVLGPLNGGIPWPTGFDGARRREHEWLSYVRGAYRLLPGYRSTRKNSSAIVAGSRYTRSQLPEWTREQTVYVPENGIEPTRFPRRERKPVGTPLKVAFVGRLVPYKGADMLLEAAAPLVRAGRVAIDVIGDGPEMPTLRALAENLQLGASVKLEGWVEHARLNDRLSEADVFAFPSIREFGGGVVLEAMALGVVPVVVDYGGPAELVTPETGFTVPIGSRASIVAGFRAKLESILAHTTSIPALGTRAQDRIFTHFTWDAKAQQTLQIYEWVLGRRARPDFGMPLDERPATSANLTT